jgi:uncharacterized cupredoxin-like copper-binding protein
MRRSTVATVVVMIGLTALVGCSSDAKTSSATTAAAGGGITVPVATGTPVAVIAGDKSETEQFLTVEPLSVKAGQVTFTFQNTGNRKHEMVVLKTDTAFDKLPINAENRVSEDETVGEIGETDQGKTVVQTFDLAAGNYVLVCNIEKHYGQGMRSAFTVTP